MAARYYRNLLQRFRRCGDMQESWALMQRWLSLEGGSPGNEEKSTNGLTLQAILTPIEDPEGEQVSVMLSISLTPTVMASFMWEKSARWPTSLEKRPLEKAVVVRGQPALGGTLKTSCSCGFRRKK